MIQSHHLCIAYVILSNTGPVRRSRPYSHVSERQSLFARPTNQPNGRVVDVGVVDARATTMRDVDDGGCVRVRCGVRDVERVRNDDDDER